MQRYAGITSAKNKWTTRSILYATDLTSDSDETLALACDMADRNCVAIEPVNVVDVRRELSSQDAQTGILYRLETLARRLKNMRRNVVPFLLFGTFEDVIAKRACDIKTRMVVFGTNGPSSAPLQETLARIRRRVPYPVAIISTRAA